MLLGELIKELNIGDLNREVIFKDEDHQLYLIALSTNENGDTIVDFAIDMPSFPPINMNHCFDLGAANEQRY